MALPSPPHLMTLRVYAQTCVFLGEGGSVALPKHIVQTCSL